MTAITDQEFLRREFQALERLNGAAYVRQVGVFLDDLAARPRLADLMQAMEESCRAEIERGLAVDLALISDVARLRAEYASIVPPLEPLAPDHPEDPRLEDEFSLAHFDKVVVDSQNRRPALLAVGETKDRFVGSSLYQILRSHLEQARWEYVQGEKRETTLHAALDPVASSLSDLRARIRFESNRHSDALQTSPGSHLLALSALVTLLNPPPDDSLVGLTGEARRRAEWESFTRQSRISCCYPSGAS
jgi:hypothetical protein